MNNRLSSHLYLHLKNIFTSRKTSEFANLLMEKPSNSFAIAIMYEKTLDEERNFKKKT